MNIVELIKESPYYLELVEKGEQIGFQKGKRQMATRLVIIAITARFGEPDEKIEADVRCLSYEQTENLMVAIFDFNNLGDVETWLSQVDFGLEE